MLVRWAAGNRLTAVCENQHITKVNNAFYHVTLLPASQNLIWLLNFISLTHCINWCHEVSQDTWDPSIWLFLSQYRFDSSGYLQKPIWYQCSLYRKFIICYLTVWNSMGSFLCNVTSITVALKAQTVDRHDLTTITVTRNCEFYNDFDKETISNVEGSRLADTWST